MLHPLKVGGTVSDGFLWWLFATVSTNQVLPRTVEYAPSLECAPQQNAGAEVGSGSRTTDWPCPRHVRCTPDCVQNCNLEHGLYYFDHMATVVPIMVVVIFRTNHLF